MINLDSLTLKYFFLENSDFINGAIVQKIQLPSRYEVIMSLRNLNLKQNRKLYININPKYPHICFIDDISAQKRDIKILKSPPAFCMQLRKYINGSKIKNFRLVEFERILEFYFDYFDEIGSLTSLCLTIELMGKHSNIILYNSLNKIILGSIHNISQEKSSFRVVYGGAKYIYPEAKTSYYLARELTEGKSVDFIQKLISGDDKNSIISYWGGKDTISGAIDDYYSDIIFADKLKEKKTKLNKYLKKDMEKLKNTVSFEPDFKKEEKYKLFGDLIMANMYNLQSGLEEVELEGNLIKLDKDLNLNQNAQKYYALYKKEKTSNEHKMERYNQAKEKLKYFEDIVFSIENASNFHELKQIKDEMIDFGLISNEQKIKAEAKVQKFEYQGFEIFLGKNNKQNDYLISKVAKEDDLWFHGFGFPSSHLILKILNSKIQPEADVLEYCARLVKQNSKAKDSNKASIIYTKRKYLRKPPNTYPGYVTYRNEKEIVIDE